GASAIIGGHGRSIRADALLYQASQSRSWFLALPPNDYPEPPAYPAVQILRKSLRFCQIEIGNPSSDHWIQILFDKSLHIPSPASAKGLFGFLTESLDADFRYAYSGLL